MKKQEILNAIYFLRRVVVHGADQDRLFETVEALDRELERKSHKSAADERSASNPPLEPRNTKS